MKNGLLVVSAFALAACSVTPPPSITYDPKDSARIRVFFLGLVREGSLKANLYFNQSCYSEKLKPSVHSFGGGGLIAGALTQNKSIGMPSSDFMAANSFQRYKEFAIPASGPITIKMNWDISGPPLTASCGAPAATFTPEAGKDYEASLDFIDAGCVLSVRKLEASKISDKMTAFPVNAQLAPTCP